jgi:hypothetical protein
MSDGLLTLPVPEDREHKDACRQLATTSAQLTESVGRIGTGFARLEQIQSSPARTWPAPARARAGNEAALQCCPRVPSGLGRGTRDSNACAEPCPVVTFQPNSRTVLLISSRYFAGESVAASSATAPVATLRPPFVRELQAQRRKLTDRSEVAGNYPDRRLRHAEKRIVPSRDPKMMWRVVKPRLPAWCARCRNAPDLFLLSLRVFRRMQDRRGYGPFCSWPVWWS